MSQVEPIRDLAGEAVDCQLIVLVVGDRRLYLDALAEYLTNEVGASVRRLPFRLPDSGTLLGDVGLVLIDPPVVAGPPWDSDSLSDLLCNLEDAYPVTQKLILGSSALSLDDKAGSRSGRVRQIGPQVSLAALAAAIRPGTTAVSSDFAKHRERTASGHPLWMLTEREISVVGLVVAGLPAGEIAGRLAISPHTVRTHVQNSMAKMGVRSRTQLVNEAVRAGIRIRPPARVV